MRGWLVSMPHALKVPGKLGMMSCLTPSSRAR